MTKPLSSTETRAWRAFVILWRLGLPQFDRTFRRHGLNHLEYGLLAVLAEQPGGTMNAGELADLAGITSSRLSHRLKTMEDRGDVERSPSPHDARGVLVAITYQGRDKIAAVSDSHTADIRRIMFDPLTEGQTDELADALMVIARHLTGHPFLTTYSDEAS